MIRSTLGTYFPDLFPDVEGRGTVCAPDKGTQPETPPRSVPVFYGVRVRIRDGTYASEYRLASFRGRDGTIVYAYHQGGGLHFVVLISESDDDPQRLVSVWMQEVDVLPRHPASP